MGWGPVRVDGGPSTFRALRGSGLDVVTQRALWWSDTPGFLTGGTVGIASVNPPAAHGWVAGSRDARRGP